MRNSQRLRLVASEALEVIHSTGLPNADGERTGFADSDLY
jgi:hypothetical protein